MTDSCILPQFTDQEVISAFRDLYGMAGPVTRLNGERDLNFRFDTDKGKVVFKIANIQETASMLECQQQVFDIMATAGGAVAAPKSIESLSGNNLETLASAAGENYVCRAVSFLDGRLLSEINPHTVDLLENLGEKVADIDLALVNFRHTALERPLLWRMNDGDSTLERYKVLISDSRKIRLVEMFQARFRKNVLPISVDLRTGTIHNDANDNNVVVAAPGPWNSRVAGIIDFGDMVYSWLAVDPAVAAAYAMLGKTRPLDAAASVIRGYHRRFPLTETEISVLYELMCMRLCLSVCICAHQQSLDPGNEYLHISEQPAWDALEYLAGLSPDFAHFVFREVCNFEPVPNTRSVISWLKKKEGSFASIIDGDLRSEPLLILDTSVASPEMRNPAETYNPGKDSLKISRAVQDNNCIAAIGKYDEYRLIYSSENFKDYTGHRRTLHLGIDIFIPEKSPLFAPMEGKVHSVANNSSPLDYGGTLILEHCFYDENGTQKVFHTLYGHLKPSSLEHLGIGDAVISGQKIGEVGEIEENGHWAPHIHFEIITHMLDQTSTFAGVGTHQHRKTWLGLCPDPNLVLGIPKTELNCSANDPDLLAEKIRSGRMKHLGPSLSLSYREPVHMVRGGMQYLYDYTGRRYLDAVNNVPHVGHCHPRVVEAERNQAGVLNTNTRYLYSEIEQYSERLLKKFPRPLAVCFLVNSGSEANDLALRLAKIYTGRQDFVVLDHAYHGNLSSLIDISPYKHDGCGGKGAPQNVHVARMPDIYRDTGYLDTSDQVMEYADSVKSALQQAETGSGAAAFIAESVLGCGGQVVLPEGYLEATYKYVREFGGVCIADEVQVGFGRVGTHFWAFETQNVVPDIVTLGKPMGNGHPLAAVITTREIADAFDNGMEYFNTFGGNPVSCAIGNAVLDIIEEENLQSKALQTGELFLARLEELKSRYPLIGDVRGLGLFIGIELVDDLESLKPAARQANYIIERMKQEGILVSTDGPLHNVLKIKPPLCFNNDNVGQFITTLDEILKEDFSQPNKYPDSH